MTAELVTGPSNASSFQLFSDGTFNYSHDATETASDSFTYQANNGQPSNTAIVAITINNTNDAPTLSLIGASPINLGTGDTFSDPGASASDEEDGNITSSIVVGGDTVNTAVPGSYVITYDVTDSGGAAAPTVTRTVNVIDDDPPVITLSGSTTINLNVGTPYSEPGFSATDNVDGDITANVVVGGDTVDTSTVGTYVITYDVSDAAGNAATQRTRTVNVSDNNPPVITLNGPSVLNLSVGDTYAEQGATAIDPEEGSVPVTIGGDTVDTSVVGTYIVTYDASDSSGNAATQVTRTVNVTDNNPPVITLIGPSTVNLNVGDTYNEQGATAIDPEEGSVPVVIGGDTVNTGVPGTYIVTYDASDSSGNSATQVTRTVNVADNNPPVITLNGPATIIIDIGDSFTDPGATAIDAEEGDLTGNIVVGGDVVNDNVPGTYVITYNVSDSAGNAATEVTRTVIVNSPPQITILGDNPVSISEGATYNDAGATANDLEDGNLTTQINTVNNVDTSVPGDYTVTYTVTDSNGSEVTAVRDVTVNPNQPPIISGQVPLSTPEETAFLLELADFTANDPDSGPENLTLIVQDGDNYTRVNNTITPLLDFNGDLTVPVIVNDGISNSAVFNATVTVTPVNDAPVISGQNSLTTLEDTSLTIQITDLTVFDPDNIFPADFTLTLLDGADYTRAGNVITPTANFNGTINVGATVSDGLLTSPVFTLVVDVTPVNDLPVVIAPIGAQNAVENRAFNLDVSGSFMDADGEPLDFAATGLPQSENIEFDGSTGVFTGTPRFEDTEPAIYTVTVTATDGAGETATDIFELTISALDRANISLGISVAPDPAMLNDELRWTFTAQNPVGPQPGAGVNLDGSFVGSGLVVTPSGTANCVIQPEIANVTDFQCTLGALPVGGSTSVVITATTSQVGDVFAFATVAGVNPVPIDPNLDDNSEHMAVGVAEVFSNGAVQTLGSANIRSVASGDIDGDGSNDIVVGTAAGQPVQVFLSGGFRDFASTPISVADTGLNEGVALADFDNNNTLDLVIANGGGQADMVYSNDGAGNFATMATLGNTFAQDVDVGDFDNDGNMDIAVAVVGANPIYLGDGNGGFNLHATLGNANSAGVAVARIDDNNRDDVVFANVGSDSSVWVKDAGAGFTLRDQLAIGDASSVAAGDLGGNARADLIFGRIPTDVGDIPSNPLLINDGSGLFGNPTELLGTSPTNDVHIGDVNTDGLPDLVFINSSGVHQIWYGNGNGYDLHAEQIVDSDAMAGVLTDLGMTDVGDPGGVDLAMGGALLAGVGVYLNDGFGNLGRGDAVPPTLTLLGDATVDVPSGSGYSDAGASAEDNIDGDVSARIIVNNPVNTAVVGTYTVTYNVSDFAGNAADTVSRTVNVTPAAGTGGGGGGATAYWSIASLLVLLLLQIALREERMRAMRGFAARDIRD